MRILWRLSSRLCVAVLLIATGWAAPPAPRANAQAGCERVKDGGFETGDAWELGLTPLLPEYVTYAKHGGERSLVLGITRGGGKQGFSSAKQLVAIPADAPKVTLSFWANTMVEGYSNRNVMQLVLLNPDDSVLPDGRLWNSINDSRVWNQYSFDLTRLRGRTVQLYFNVYNDGTSNTAGLFLDDVSLIACSSATATPTRTPTPTGGVATPWPTLPPRSATPTLPTTPTITATATPTNCINILLNGDFENGLAPWEAGPAEPAAQVQRVTSPVRSPQWALRLGVQTANVFSQSPVRQVVAIQAGSQPATLQFYVSTWSESPAGNDWQEAGLFDENAALLTPLFAEISNAPAWRMLTADLTPYRGQTVQLLFNVYNDGAAGKTAMFLDDVSLVVCNATPVAAAARAVSGPALPWPELGAAQLTAGRAIGPPVARSFVPAATVTTEPAKTRVGVITTPAPPATAGRVTPPTLTPTRAPTTRPESATRSRVLETWQTRWWVIVVALALLAALAILTSRAGRP